MVFTSTLFLLVFLPLFLLVYHITPHKGRNWVALIASLLFYAWGAPKFIFLLVGLLVSNFYIVRKMYENKQKKVKICLLCVSLLINLGVLAYFKYANFFIENLNSLLSNFGHTNVEWTKVILPIGISFFTFQSVTYTLDIFWGKHKPLKEIKDYLLYILLFPQLIAGPIIRFNTIADEIKDRKKNDTIDYKLEGIYLFILGLSKKVLIANQVGEFVDTMFSSSGELFWGHAWLGIIGYSIQIYFDFAGYSDMAIGLGKIMGFNFPENFKSPYSSKSITEFWRRWHITLGTFMKDYLYIPLGGNRSSSESRNYVNLIIVFLLSGLWHGASWNFVIWGAWHGLFLMLEKLFLTAFLNKMWKGIQVIYTYLIVLIGWVFFRVETFSEATRYIKAMFSNFYTEELIEIPSNFYFFLVIGLLFSFITLFKFGEKWEEFFYYKTYKLKEHISLSIMSLGFLILSLSYIFASGFNPFIYFRF